MKLSKDKYNWSVLPVYPNQVYVDSVAGNDANAGTLAAPLKTLNAALKVVNTLKNNVQVNLKRGCTWTEAFAQWWVAQNSTLTAYGSGARPIIIHPDGNSQDAMHIAAPNVQIVSIDWMCGGHNPNVAPYDPTAAAFGIRMDNGAANILVEDCRFQFFFQTLCVSGGLTTAMQGLRVNRSVICDSHAVAGHAQGAWINSVADAVFDECIIDHNGWAQDSTGKVYGSLDMFSHNIYGSDDGELANVTFTNCLLSRAGGNGLMLRQGGNVTGNLFVENGIHGQNLVVGGNNSTVENNVFIGLLNRYPVGKGGGVDFESANGNIENNLFIGVGPRMINGGPTEAYAICIDGIRASVKTPTLPKTVNIVNNIDYGYGGDGLYINNNSRDVVNIEDNYFLMNDRKTVNLQAFTGLNFKNNHWTIGSLNPYNGKPFCFSNNGQYTFAQFVAAAKATTDDQVAPTFADPTRTLETYAASIGLAADGPTLIAAMKNLCKFNWNAALLPSTIVAYLFDGFTVTSVTQTPSKLTGTIIGTAGSWNNSGNTIDKAFDGNAGSFFDGPVPNGCWVGLDLGTSRTITEIDFEPREGWSGYPQRMVGGQFQGANLADFSDAVILYSITTLPTATDNLTINNTNKFRYVRYMSPPNSYGNIAELSFIGM